MAVKSKPNEIHLTRVYDAPVKMVWDAWEDPEQVAKWWGPRGFTLTTRKKELRVGGVWDYTMHGPDGTDWVNKTLYHEVIKYKKLVYDHGGNDERAPLFRVTVFFTDLKGKTQIDMTMALPTAEAAAETRKFIKKAGGDSTWDRLAEYLAKESNGKEKFVINRSFDVSRETMFKVWSEPEQLTKWLPPTGFRMERLSGDIQKGSKLFYMMTNDSGVEMYGRIEYLEIQRPESFVYTQQFCDKQGNVSRHPGAPTWPETMLTKITLTEEDTERTRVTVEWEPYGMTTADELKAFVKERAGMTQGWTGSFDKLEEYLARKK